MGLTVNSTRDRWNLFRYMMLCFDLLISILIYHDIMIHKLHNQFYSYIMIIMGNHSSPGRHDKTFLELLIFGQIWQIWVCVRRRYHKHPIVYHCFPPIGGIPYFQTAPAPYPRCCQTSVSATCNLETTKQMTPAQALGPGRPWSWRRTHRLYNVKGCHM